MRTVTIDGVQWHVELTGPGQLVHTENHSSSVKNTGVRFSRAGDPRSRIGYVMPGVPLEEVADLALSVAFDEGFWEDQHLDTPAVAPTRHEA